ncbi:hypothetical protein ABFS82_14G138500 [Erythranthe guttata]
MEQLNLDLLSEILSRLRVKHLIKLKSVCKSWQHLISDEDFIKLHLKKSRSRFTPLKNEYFIPCPRLLPPPDEHGLFACCPSESTMVLLGSSTDGLVCLFNRKFGIIHIWNPSIRSSACIPIKKPDDKIEWFWFGLHDNVYKILLATSHQIHLIRPYADYYTYKSTREFVQHYTPVNGGMGTLFNGNVHWPVHENRERAPYRYFTILSYGLIRETLGEIPVPPIIQEHIIAVDLGEIDGCLSCLVLRLTNTRGAPRENEYEIWSMKEYGVAKSWVKLMNVSERTYSYHRYCVRKEEVEEDHARIKSPLYGKQVYVESLVSPRQGECCRSRFCCCR